MALLVMSLLTVIWFLIAELTGKGWAYGIMFAHMGVICMGIDSMI